MRGAGDSRAVRSRSRAGGSPIFLILAALLFPFAASAEPLAADVLGRKLDAALAPYFPHDQPGGAMILTREGRWVFRKAYGLADRERDVALRPEMAFRIGSVTKQLTAAAILLLADEGKLALSDEVTKFLPGFKTRGRRITIEHLLTHSSGLRSYTDTPLEVAALAVDRPVAEVLADIQEEPFRFEPGEDVYYSNSNYFLLGAIVEKVSGTPYPDFMAARVFEPLGMRSTAYEGFERNGVQRVEGYQRGRSKPFEKAPPISMTLAYAAGAVISTVDDLALWGEAIDRGTLLTAASWKRMFTPYRLTSGRPAKVTPGWVADRRTFGRDVFAHAGGINGFAAFVYWVPKDRIFIAVLLNNAGQATNAMHLAQTMLHIALTPAD